jgi:PadR family transcriptional regulator, regulatory protein PadR
MPTAARLVDEVEINGRNVLPGRDEVKLEVAVLKGDRTPRSVVGKISLLAEYHLRSSALKGPEIKVLPGLRSPSWRIDIVGDSGHKVQVDTDGTALAVGRFPHARKGLRMVNGMAKVKAAGAGNFFALCGDAVLRMDVGREQDGCEHSEDCASHAHVSWTRSREIRYRLHHRQSGDWAKMDFPFSFDKPPGTLDLAEVQRHALDKSNFFSIVELITERGYLGEFEMMILQPVIDLGEEAYGVPISQALEKHRGRGVAAGSVYAALERLENKGLVSSSLGDPTRERGKAKRFFRVTKTGLRQVNETRRILTELWQRLPKLTEERT